VNRPTTPRTAPAPDAEDRGAPASPEDRTRRLLLGPATWIFLILVGLLGAFSVLSPDAFLSVQNFRNLGVDASLLLVLAVGQTFVIITAGIDLSVGAVLVFSSVVGIKAMDAVGGDGWLPAVVGLVACMTSGLAWGWLNGLLITKARIPPLIATLGTLGMALGLALVITDGLDLSGVPRELLDVGTANMPGGIPYLVLISGAIALLGGIVLAATRFGGYTYAIGSNPEAARRVGIAIDRHLVKVYALSGLLSGVAGYLSLARFASTTINGHDTDNLQAIAAVVIGGTSLFGGIGTMIGSVVGVFIPTVLQNGFVILEIQPFWQQFAVGVILLVAVFLDQLRRRKRV
jgi:ribose transport system permease protein